MNKSFTSVADLLADESFVEYCTQGENSRFWKNYIGENPAQKPLIEEAKKTLFLLRESFAEEDMEGQLAKLKSLVSKQKGTKTPAGQEPTKIRKLSGAFRYAAAAAVIVFVVLIGYQYFENKTDYRVYISEVGSRKTIVLPDSTQVILNSNSILKVPEGFNKKNREVLLSGAAFFEVAHDEQHPFSVTARNLTTKVLGTSFFVRDYQNENKASVMLLTGKVKVKQNSPSTVFNLELRPGEKAVFDRENDQFQKGNFDQTALLNWKTGRLAFNNAPFEKVVHKLELWYGVEISVHGARKDLHFTGRFENESLENILKVIGFTMNCRYKITENKVNIHF